MNQVIFQAKLAQVTLSKTNKAVLELPEDMSFEKLAQIAKFRGSSIVIQFGNPQAGIEDYGVQVEQQRQGLTVITGPSGVVESVFHDSDDDEEQEKIDITDEPEVPETEQESDESSSEESDPNDFELDYGNHEQEAESEDETDDEEGSQESDPVTVEGKDELEEFILSGKAPVYDDIPYDFPELLRRKRSGEKWMTIANSIGVTSTILASAWSKYRKKVKSYMEGEEHGAA